VSAEWDDALAKRQRDLAELYCTNGHAFRRNRSMHLGDWKACKRCGLIVPLPTLTVVR
jgi:hypothetical protein